MESVRPNSRMARLLDWCQAQGATDLHVRANRPLCLRINGALSEVPPEVSGPLSQPDLLSLLRETFSPGTCDRIEAGREVDVSFYHGELRYRANFSKQKGQQSFSFRTVPQQRMKFMLIAGTCCRSGSNSR